MQGREDQSKGGPFLSQQQQQQQQRQQEGSRSTTLPPPPSSTMLTLSRVPPLPSPPQPDRNGAYPSDQNQPGRIFSPVSAGHRLPPLASSVDRLPSLSQLLTSSSQNPAVGTSPYYERSHGQDWRIELPSPRARTPVEASNRPATSYFQQYDTWREHRSENRPAPGPLSTASLSQNHGQTGMPASGGISSPQYSASEGHGQTPGPLPPALRTPTNWNSTQSPQSTTSPIPSTSNGTSSASRPLERPTTGKKLVGERMIPGEGRVFVYDDGTKIPTIVDGEPVNGQWGMTKAGKPRKRMPQACIACRQKKIKCDPGEGKCAQCEKSGKDCKYSEGYASEPPKAVEPSQLTNCSNRAHKSGASSPSRDADPETPENDQMAYSPQPATFGTSGKKRSASVDLFKSTHKRIASMDTMSAPERVYHGQNWTASISEDERGRLMPAERTRLFEPVSKGTDSSADFWSAGMPLDGNCLIDPFLAEPERATYYLQRFFDCIHSTVYRVFPRATFEAWACNLQTKSRGEVTVICGMLAGGCLFSDDVRAKSDSERYVKAARCGIETAPKGQGLLFVLARLMLGHYYFTLGDFNNVLEINDLTRAVASLPRDLETQLRHPSNDNLFDFGVNEHQLRELHRRTQWLAFIIDRFIGVAMNYPLCFDKRDQLARLPCDDGAYDRGEFVCAPYFDTGDLGRKYAEPQPSNTPQSIWSYFIQGVSFDSDIRAQIHRSAWHDEDAYPGNYDSFRKRMARELHMWLHKLPADLQFNDANIKHHLHANTVGLFLAIHALYHTCHLNLNRRARANLLPQSSLTIQAREAYWHAKEIIQQAGRIHDCLDEELRLGHKLTYQPSPHLGFTILAAMDVITCCGLAEMVTGVELSKLCDIALESTARSAVWYASSRSQLSKLTARIDEIKASVGKNSEAWICMNPLQPYEPAHMDVFYQDQGGVRPIVLSLYQVNPEAIKVEYLQKQRNQGMMDRNLGVTWAET